MQRRFSLFGACALALGLALALMHVGLSPARAEVTDPIPAPAAVMPDFTIVSANITTHTTWTKAASPYSLTQYIHIQAGIMLTIEPGVEVQFPSAFVGLGVQGRLLAVGTPAEPITFTSRTKQPGSWGGIDVTTGATATLQYVILEYGRNNALVNDGMVSVSGGTLDLSQSTVRYGGSNGIASDLGLTSTVQVSATSFISNARSALRFYSFPPTARDPLLRNLTASSNGLNAIEYGNVDFTGPHQWANAGLPYAATAGFAVNDTGSLTIEPGVEVQANSAFAVYGSLTALGTPAQPITFTGVSKTPGSWWGLNVSTVANITGTLALRNVTIEYGGFSQGANLSIGFNTLVSVTQTTIRSGSKHGLAIAGSGGDVRFSDISLTGNNGYPIYLSNTTDPVLHNISAGGNLTQAVGIGPYFSWFNGKHLWQNIGLPYIVEAGLTIGSAAELTIEPGVELRMRQGWGMNVNGSLYAVGTPALPITITGDFTGSPTPGWWRGVAVGIGARAIFRYCDIGYGGAAATAMLGIATNQVILQDCRIHHSASDGILAIKPGGLTARPFIVNNRIEQNAMGLRNTDLSFDYVDATYNWWGDASGPHHATNPGGLGNAVSDHVLFDPWLTSPPAPSAALDVQINGPAKFAPGRVEEYAVRYTNNTTQTIQSAVLMVALPTYADYLDDSGGGIIWPQRRQLFWKMGDIPPGTTGLRSFRVRYQWGLPIGMNDSAVAELGGANFSVPNFNVQSYLNYVPNTEVAEVPLSAGQVQLERQQYPQFNQLYNQALQEGYTSTVANRIVLSSGELMTEVVLLHLDPQNGVMFLRRMGDRSQAVIIDETTYRVRMTAGTLSFNFLTDEWDILGPGSAATTVLSPETASLTFGECMKNCILEKLPKYVVKNVFKSVSIVFKAIDCYKAVTGKDPLDGVKCAQIIKKVPGVSEGIDLGRCNSDCQADPNSHVCTADFHYCQSGGLYGFFGIHSIETCKCIQDPATGREGMYLACETVQVCAICEKCIETDNGPLCAVPDPSGGGLSLRPATVTSLSGDSDSTCAECIRAKDPNAKYGPAGDVLPGQLMTYTINFENEGAGTAYDVFVVDPLAGELDTSRMTIYGGGEYIAASRSIIWWAGNLAPKGQPGASGVVSFTVWLKPNVPNGTSVVNQAVVHFPSVPEVTPTNAVVNLVQPLAAIPQSLETQSGQPVAIHLAGRDPLGAPLGYALVEKPLYGQLSGTPPNLIYTPAAGFTGIDHLRFTVSNATTTSRPAFVDVLVQPSPSDTTPPQVIRTRPANGEAIPPIANTPHFTDTLGPLYLPAIQIDFSETISDTSVTTNTIKLVDSNGHAIALVVGYDGAANEAIVLMREAPKPGMQYNVTLTTGIRDLRGNALANNYTFSFRMGGTNKLYLPLIRR